MTQLPNKRVTLFLNSDSQGVAIMRIHASKLVPGCILTKDVIGKSGRPIIPKNTTLTEEHINILHKFLIEEVDISYSLSERTPAKNKEQDQETETKDNSLKRIVKNHGMIDEYKEAVSAYKRLFQKWQNHIGINLTEVRNIIIPLLEKIEDMEDHIHTLYRYVEKEDFIYYHSVSLAVIAAHIAKKMNLQKSEWLQVGMAGLLSDCGLAKLDPKIVFKQSPYTAKEKQILNVHPRESYYLVEPLTILSKSVKLAILQHHEAMDGSGYPLGLTQDKIHIYARILSVCDEYHRNLCTTFQEKGLAPFQVIKLMERAQYNKCDPRVVRYLIHDFVADMVGKKVILSNGEKGEIIFIDEEKPHLPMIRLEKNKEIISLEHKTNISVVNILHSEVG